MRFFLLYYIPEVIFYLFKGDYMFAKRTGSVHAPHILRQTERTLTLGFRVKGLGFRVSGSGVSPKP